MTVARLISEAVAAEQLPATGDVLAVGLPFLRQLHDLHQRGRVSGLSGPDGVTYDGSTLRLDRSEGAERTGSPDVLRRFERPARGVAIANRIGIDHGRGDGAPVVRHGDVFDPTDPEAPVRPERPMLVVGYRAWEQHHGVADELTDVHLAGLLLTSYAVGLDLDLTDAVEELSWARGRLRSANARLHPVVAGVLAEMIDPDRHRRPPDLGQVIARLEHHRDLPADLDLGDAYASSTDWRRAVLSTLRDRVFDLSRRNRALYFRPTSGSVSLTEASVPLLLDVERISPSDVLTWSGSGAAAFRSGRAVDLGKWCRFEEAPHLAPGLDKLISTERKLRAEHGQGRLRLVIAFLRWVDPESGETVNSPLLSLPAELSRKKGVTNRYRVEVDGDAEVNPVLRHVFRSRFGLTLAEAIDSDPASIERFVRELEADVRATEPSVQIDLVDTPRIDLIRRRAQLRVDAYLKRRAQTRASTGRWRRQDHSYARDDWRPLGLALYRRFVEPEELPLRSLSGAPARPRRPEQMVGRTAATSTAVGERETEGYRLAAGDVHASRWEVDLCSVTLASLGSRRSSLSRDYDELLADSNLDARTADDRSPFELLFAPEPKAPNDDSVASLEIDQLLVLPADDAQAAAVRRGVRGDSFIIQGPPGTGKSQTITNLIAAMVAEGKRVLFVCEKRAALDVVAHRLRQVGLGALVATIHDSQLDRKEFIADLGATYEAWLADTDTTYADGRADAVDAVRRLLAPLEDVYAELHDARGDRRSIAELIERLVALRQRQVASVSLDGAGDVSAEAWLSARPAIDRVAATRGDDGPPSLAGAEVLRMRPDRLASGDPVVTVRAVGDELRAAAVAMSESLGSNLDAGSVTIRSLGVFGAWGPTFGALADRGSLAVLDRSSGAHLDLRAAARRSTELRADADAAAAVSDRWTSPLAPDDARAALEIAIAKERSAFRFLSGPWRRVRSLTKDAYRWGLHQIDPPTSQILGDLVAWYDAVDAVAQHESSLVAGYGTADVAAIIGFVDQLGDDPITAGIVQGDISVAAFGSAAARLASAVEDVVVDSHASVADLGRTGAAMARASVVDERSLIAWSALHDVDPVLLSMVVGSGASLDEIERAVLSAAIERVGDVATMSGARVDDTVERVHDAYRRLLAANATYVAGRATESFREHVAFSEASMAGRSDEDKAFKRAYKAGRKLVEREFQKKMRHRSIRELSSGEPGLVVRDLKPVWLMSPLSVSDTLPLDDDTFDVVVFDEASQVAVEDAVPTLFRGRQTVVVGDRMQLPPTRFFSTDTETELEDDIVVLDESGHRMAVTLDADSFLTQADLALDSSMLTWHYRSRSESLIAYSNHAFYDARLATVPDRAFDDDDRESIVVSVPEDARARVVDLLARPISFHRMEDGRYEDRRNVGEADYIAELVRSLLAAGTDLTIGVVAFSEAQQTQIESSLAELALLDPVFAERYENEVIRTDEGEFVGLFVKNLENVQGDERDVIIMSVCYGPGPDGRIRMNFGPINQAGGERRLNVIFSRAKQHMAIVSSMRGADITNTHNEGAAHLARFLDYAAAESVGGVGGDGVLRSLRVGGDEVGSDGPDVAAVARRSAVAAELARQLRAEGLAVDVGVGRSGFTVDVGIRGEEGYRLGVLVDPGPPDASLTDRIVSEAGVLSAFGWPITRVFVSEWWTDPETVVARVVTASTG